MVSFHTPFIKTFKCLRQLKMKGNIADVPINFTKSIYTLPRRAKNLTAIQMMKRKLKRKSFFKKHYLYHNIRLSLIVSALNNLST